MVYYKVKKQYDQWQMDNGDILIGGELYTEKEFLRLGLVPVGAFERVEVSKFKTYFFFGARFEGM